jgi:hypothetical protein
MAWMKQHGGSLRGPDATMENKTSSIASKYRKIYSIVRVPYRLFKSCHDCQFSQNNPVLGCNLGDGGTAAA